jgi:hypothetical protein
MSASKSDTVRKTKNRIGMVAILLLVLFTILALVRVLSALEWIILDLIVALVANILLRRAGRSSDSRFG